MLVNSANAALIKYGGTIATLCSAAAAAAAGGPRCLSEEAQTALSSAIENAERVFDGLKRRHRVCEIISEFPAKSNDDGEEEEEEAEAEEDSDDVVCCRTMTSSEESKAVAAAADDSGEDQEKSRPNQRRLHSTTFFACQDIWLKNIKVESWLRH